MFSFSHVNFGRAWAGNGCRKCFDFICPMHISFLAEFSANSTHLGNDSAFCLNRLQPAELPNCAPIVYFHFCHANALRCNQKNRWTGFSYFVLSQTSYFLDILHCLVDTFWYFDLPKKSLLNGSRLKNLSTRGACPGDAWRRTRSSCATAARPRRGRATAPRARPRPRRPPSRRRGRCGRCALLQQPRSLTRCSQI